MDLYVIMLSSDDVNMLKVLYILRTFKKGLKAPPSKYCAGKEHSKLESPREVVISFVYIYVLMLSSSDVNLLKI